MIERKRARKSATHCKYWLFFWTILAALAAGGAGSSAWASLPGLAPRTQIPAVSERELQLDLGASSSYFAGEVIPTSRLELDLGWQSPDGMHEARLRTFIETGEGAHRSIDIDPVVFRAPIFGTGHLWVGRTHPGQEGLKQGDFSSTGAIGHNWVQNQSTALTPRVAGWIGMGLHHSFGDTGLSVTGAYSPVFLPNFGPSLSFSETEETEGSRFARLPPSYIRLNDNAVVPLRYRIETGDLKDIVFQHQAFVSGAYTYSKNDRPLARLSLMAWTAPDPAPSVDAAGKLMVTQQDVRVLVTAHPSFLRRKYFGGRLQLFALPGSPELESALDPGRGQWTWSLGFKPFSTDRHMLRVGLLNEIKSFEAEASAPSATASMPRTPDYADGLLWAEYSRKLGAKLSSRVRLEHHLADGNRGNWFQSAFEYTANRRLTLFAEASILTGEDQSYFGTWRSLDSVGVGARYVW